MPTLNWLTRETPTPTPPPASPIASSKKLLNLSTGDPDADNMLIQGDNLEALKALLPFYAGQVKCIYIDPPYNTRSAFRALRRQSRTQQVAGDDMAASLNFCANLLAEDGSIWVSIDDNEGALPQGHHGRDVFGRSN